MLQWEFQRNVTSMRLTAEMAAAAGVPLRESLAGTGVSPRQLTDPDRVVSGQQELRLIRNVLAHLDGHTALGLRAGQRYHFTAYGSLGFAFASNRSARSALDDALRYFNLTFSFVRFVVSDSMRETRVTVHDDEVPADVAAFVVERAITALVTIGRDLYDTAPQLLRLDLRAAQPADDGVYREFFRLKPRFGADRNVVVFDRKELEQPLALANEPARQTAIEQCRVQLETRKAGDGLAQSVRSRLIAGSTRMPTMPVVANDLCMTSRTLRRRLLDEGTRFVELREQVRRSLADDLLRTRQLSIGQIAERLGYAESTGFISAFRRWHGTTPHAFRKTCRRSPQ